jgi:ADP-dependent NAD(P)H-hydrate dehydratase
MAVRAGSIIDARWLQRFPLPTPEVDGDKEARGRVLVVGGARQMPGPIILAATAALRAGAGKLQIATVESLAPHVAAAVPEALVHGVAEARDGGFAPGALGQLRKIAADVGALLIGPGMLESRVVPPLVRGLLARLGPEQTVVIDAAALAIFQGFRRASAERRQRFRHRCPIIITPHAGEMATLLGADKASVREHPEAVVREAAHVLDVVAILKGADTFICAGDRLACSRAGNVGLATSGSGDVLAGLVAGLAARGAAPFLAAAWAVHLHGLAGERLKRRHGPLGYLAREIAGEIPALMARLGRRPRVTS